MFYLTRAFLCCLILCIGQQAIAQKMYTKHPSPKVFLDCQTRCYFSHIRTELHYIYFVRDRQESDVYLQLTSLSTGSGGRQYSLAAIGENGFTGMNDTTVFYSPPDITDAAEQDVVLNGVRNALLPYVLKSELAEFLVVDVDLPDDKREKINGFHDPWNYWVYRLGGNASVSSVETSRDIYLSGNISASRVTEGSKFTGRLNSHYTESTFDLGDETQFVSIIKSYNADLTYVKSVSDHWSVGGFTRAWNNSYTNYKFSWSIQPAIEYNLYPYAEATTRQFTFLYRIGPAHNTYVDTTIFDIKDEWVGRHYLSVHYKRLEPWGTASLYFSYGNYLHDWELMSMSLHPRVEWNLAKGLYLNMRAGISLIRDQINIVKAENVSNEERLLRIKQLQTDYRMNASVGLSYRFGSSNNNIVNTRF